MIESIFQAFLTALGEGLELVVQLFLGCISFDIEQFSNNFPIAQTLYMILQGVSFGLVFGICIFQLVKFFTGPLTDSTETPLRICARCVIACACILIGNYGLVAVCNLFSYPYADMLAADGVQYQLSSIIGNITYDGGAGFVSAAQDGLSIATGGMSVLAMLIIALIVLLLLAWNLIKLILEVVERYLVLMSIIYTSPLGWATFASESTAGIFKKWLSMFFTQCIMMLLNVWSFKVILSVLGTGGADDSSMFMRLILGLAFCKVAQRMDTYLNQLGASPAITGQNMLDDIVGISAFTRSIIGNEGNFYQSGKKILGRVASIFGGSGSDTPPPVPPSGDIPPSGGPNGTKDGVNSNGNSGGPSASGGASGSSEASGSSAGTTKSGTKTTTANGTTGQAENEATSFESYASKGGKAQSGPAGEGMGAENPSGSGTAHSPASRLSPLDQDVMRVAMTANGGAAPTEEQLNDARAQATKFNGDLDKAGLHMDENGRISPNGRSTGTYDVGKFARDKAGSTAVGDSAIARTISGSGKLGKQIAQDAIMNNANPIRSDMVGAAAAAAILNSAKDGVGSLNSSGENSATAIGGLGENAIKNAVPGVDGLSTGNAPNVGDSIATGNDATAVTNGTAPTMGEDGTVINGTGGSVSMDAEGNVANRPHTYGGQNGTTTNRETPDLTQDVGSANNGSSSSPSVQAGNGPVSDSVDYVQFASALNATASGTATSETGSVSDMVAGNGEIVGTYNPPMQQVQAVDSSTGAPLFNEDGTPKMESTPAVSSQPKNFSIMSNDAWNKLPADARAGYKSFTTEGGKEFRIKMTDAKIAGAQMPDVNTAGGKTTGQAGKTLGGGGKGRRNKGNRRRK